MDQLVIRSLCLSPHSRPLLFATVLNVWHCLTPTGSGAGRFVGCAATDCTSFYAVIPSHRPNNPDPRLCIYFGPACSCPTHPIPDKHTHTRAYTYIYMYIYIYEYIQAAAAAAAARRSM